MTDAWLMEADCIHGNTWFECPDCEALIDERDLLRVDDSDDIAAFEEAEAFEWWRSQQ